MSDASRRGLALCCNPSWGRQLGKGADLCGCTAQSPANSTENALAAFPTFSPRKQVYHFSYQLLFLHRSWGRNKGDEIKDSFLCWPVKVHLHQAHGLKWQWKLLDMAGFLVGGVNREYYPWKSVFWVSSRKEISAVRKGDYYFELGHSRLSSSVVIEVVLNRAEWQSAKLLKCHEVPQYPVLYRLLATFVTLLYAERKIILTMYWQTSLDLACRPKAWLLERSHSSLPIKRILAFLDFRTQLCKSLVKRSTFSRWRRALTKTYDNNLSLLNC